MAQRHFKGSSLEEVQNQAHAEATRLWDSFSLWRSDQDAFAKMLNPAPNETGRAYGVADAIAATKNREAERSKSQFISEWAGTRSEAKLARLTMADTVIETATIQQDDEELIASADFEDLLHGILAGFDDDTARQWLDISWDRTIKAFITFTGKAVTRIHVRPKVKGSKVVKVHSDVLDPYQVAHSFGPGVRKFLYRFTKPIGDARAMMPGLVEATMPDITGKNDDDLVTIDDYWVEEMDPEDPELFIVTNTLLIEGLAVHPHGFRETAFKRLPHQIVNISSQARLPGTQETQASMQEWSRYHARPFFARARYTLPLYEDILALKLDEMALAIHPPRQHKNPNNPGQLAYNPEDRAPDADLVMADDDATVELEKTSAAALQGDTVTEEIKAVLNSIMSDLLVTGLFPRDTSGYLYNSAIQQGELVLAPEAKTSASLKKQNLEEGLHQFLNMDDESEIHLSFISPTIDLEKPQQFRMRKYTKKDIPQVFDMLVLEPPMLPRDPLQQMTLFERGTASGAFDRITGRAVALKFRDGVGMERRYERQKVRDSQELQRTMISQTYEREIARLQAEADSAEADGDRGKAVQLQAIAGALEQDLARILGQQNVATKQPPGPGGILPQVQPPEARDNPDEAAARGEGG